jgi:hypothetical protein
MTMPSAANPEFDLDLRDARKIAAPVLRGGGERRDTSVWIPERFSRPSHVRPGACPVEQLLLLVYCQLVQQPVVDLRRRKSASSMNSSVMLDPAGDLLQRVGDLVGLTKWICGFAPASATVGEVAFHRALNEVADGVAADRALPEQVGHREPESAAPDDGAVEVRQERCARVQPELPAGRCWP